MANIKQVKIGSTPYDIEALHFNGGTNLDTPAQWKAYIDSIGDLGFEIFTDLIGKTLPTADATSYGKYKNGIVLCNNGETPETGSYIEWVIVRTGTSSSYSYAWEKIGTTSADLSDYVKKNTEYSGAALSNGAHTHTVAVPTINVDKTLKLGATAAGTAVNPTKKYLATTSVTGVSGSTTASKATAGTAVTVAKKAASATTVGNANVGTAVTFNAVSSSTDVSATNIATPGVTTVTEVTAKTAGTAASWSANVTDGVLSFSWTANTPTSVTTGDIKGVVISGATTPSATAVTASKVSTASKSIAPAVASETEIYGVDGTESITPYTFADVTVPKAATATTVATGAIAATGTSGNEVVTAVSISAQPTITITEAATNTGPVNEHVTTGTASATTSENGAHAHNVKVTS